MTSKEQSNEFVKKLIIDEENEYVQKPMPNGYLNKIFQYVGVKRIDEKGFVQVGYSPQRLQEAEQLADILHISKDFRIGNNGKPSLCVYRRFHDLILRASIPEDEMFLSRNTVLLTMAIAYFILFTIVFILISQLLQWLVF